MLLSPKNIIGLVIFLALWIGWCFFVINDVTPWVELHLNIWRWLAAWILCLIPLILLTTVLVFRVKNKKV